MTSDYFSPDYRTARDRFREAVDAAGGRLETIAIDARGPAGESLTIDIGWFGAERPRRVVLHSSGIHGVEGFAGSAVQLQFLAAMPPLDAGHAVVLVHFLNPYGGAWLRRVNEENVDLNRNFLGPGEAYAGGPAGYAALDPLLNPPSPPASDFFYAQVVWQIAQHGLTSLKQSAAAGQYDYPRGLFFGGQRLQQGPERYEAFLRERLAGAARVIAIDIHAGVGDYGEDLLLAEDEEYEAARLVFGPRVVLADPHRSAAYRIRGGYERMLGRVFPGASVHFVAQEFGTYGPLHVVRALREENRWHHHGDGSLTHPSKVALREAFAPDDDAWRQAVLDRGEASMQQAVQALAVDDLATP
ncbi:MAG TPA: DUF2817 domain-containing protein [Methylomirabilota bacterium]|nr:DUF2817 domain-containing protein [Methylomirabilota bacterium]